MFPGTGINASRAGEVFSSFIQTWEKDLSDTLLWETSSRWAVNPEKQHSSQRLALLLLLVLARNRVFEAFDGYWWHPLLLDSVLSVGFQPVFLCSQHPPWKTVVSIIANFYIFANTTPIFCIIFGDLSNISTMICICVIICFYYHTHYIMGVVQKV